MVVTLKNEVVGRILLEIKKGRNYFRALELSGLPPSTLSRYLPLMERDGLISIEIDPQTRRRILKLNESRMDEIERLIQTYLEYEISELKKKVEFAIQYIDFKEKERNEVMALIENLRKKLIYS